MSKRLRPRAQKSRSLRPRSQQQKPRELEVPAQATEELLAAEGEAEVPQQDAEPEVEEAPPVAAAALRLEEPAPAEIEERITAHDPALARKRAAAADLAIGHIADASPIVKLSAAPVEEAPAPKSVAPQSAAPQSETAASKKSSKKSKTDAAPASASASTKAPPRSEEESPVSSRSASSRDKELLESGVSAEFFRNDEDSVPPFVEPPDEVDDLAHARALSPSTIARRARLRRIVAGVVTFAAVLSIGILGKKLMMGSKASAAAPPAKQELVVVAPPVETAQIAAPKPAAEEVKPVAKADPAASAEPASSAAAVDTSKPAEPEAKADPAKPEAKADDKPAEPEAKAPDAATAAELKKKAESLLNRGDRKGAIPVAQAAIEADPSDAYPYLLLGSALQDSGKWKDGVEQYCECVRHATRGPINECRAMGGHK